MLVKIEQIPEAGLHLTEPVGLELLAEALGGGGDAAREGGFQAMRPATLKVFLRKVSGGVLVEGSLTPHVRSQCKRCAVDVELDVPVSFTLNLIPESLARGEDYLDKDEEAGEKGQPESEGSFGLSDADEQLFDGKKIDLDPIVREQVLLALPMSTVCREDCAGLCTVCGQNQNEKKCGCETKIVDPRLAPLKNIKLN